MREILINPLACEILEIFWTNMSPSSIGSKGITSAAMENIKKEVAFLNIKQADYVAVKSYPNCSFYIQIVEFLE
jgi:hypothetical protein